MKKTGLLVFVFVLMQTFVFAASITLTKGALGGNPCVGGDSLELFPIIFNEGNAGGGDDNDFTNDSLIILKFRQGNFKFVQVLTDTIIFRTGEDIDSAFLSVFEDSIIIRFYQDDASLNNNNDRLSIIGLYVKAINAGKDTLFRSGGNAIFKDNIIDIGDDFAYMEAVDFNGAFISDSTNVSCNGGSDGQATIRAGVLDSGYTFSWLGGGPGPGFADSVYSGLVIGSQTGVVMHWNACYDTASVNITEPALALSISVTGTTDASTSGGTDGQIVTNTIGGTTSYLYQWIPDPGPSTGESDTNNNLPAGTYKVVVTDNNGCTDSVENITIADGFSPGTIGTNFNVCEDSIPQTIINLSPAMGGTGSFTYSWEFSTDLATWTIIASATGISYSPPVAITQTTYYRRKARDGAVDSAYSNIVSATFVSKPTVVLFVPDDPTTPVDSEYCTNGAAWVLFGSPSGGSFSGTAVSGNVFDPKTLAAPFPKTDVITYTYTDGNGCTNSMSDIVLVRDTPSLSISLSATYANNEADDIFTVTPSGGTISGPGLVNDSTFSPSSLDTGSYKLTYTYTDPASGCQSSIVKQVQILPSGGTIIGNDLLCTNGGLEGYKGFGVASSSFPNLTTYTNMVLNPPAPGFTWITSTDSGTLNPNLTGSYSGNVELTYNLLTYNFVTFTYDLVSTVTVSKLININAPPTPNFSIPKSAFCLNDDSVILSSNFAPNFSGPGIATGGLYFDPVKAGLGNHNLTYIATDGSTTCSASTTKNVTVDSVPIVSIIGLIDSQFCESALDVLLTGIPGLSGGDSARFAGSGTGMSGSIFSPSLVDLGTIKIPTNYTISYFYEDANGCSDIFDTVVLVNPDPIVAFSIAPASEYCIGASMDTIAGNQGGSGLLTGLGVIGDFFNPNVAGPGTHNISFIFTNATGCTDTVTNVVTVYALPDISIDTTVAPWNPSGTTDMCIGDGGTINFLLTNPSPGTVTFIWNSVPNSSAYNSTLHGIGQDTILVKYQFDPAFGGCVNTDTHYVNIIDKPNANFDVGDFCFLNTTTDSIPFNDSSTYSGTDSIVKWKWFYGYPGSPIDSFTNPTNPKHRFPGPANYDVRLEVTSKVGCNDVFIKTAIPIVSPPVANFNEENVCFGNSTLFNDSSFVDVGSITSWNWNFDDIGSGGANTSTMQSPIHNFTASGTYNITLVVRSNSQCIDSFSKMVNIRPNVILNPTILYQEGFEDTIIQGWLRGGVNPSWQVGAPADSFILNAALGNNAWVTNLSGLYNAGEQSYIESPCFDFSALSKPMISMDIIKNMESSDGAVLQLTVDSGRTWQRVGTVGSGQNWYDKNAIPSNPGYQVLGQEGWTNSSPNATWQTTKHILDNVAGNPALRFRIAFASIGGTIDKSGIGIDNVIISERSRISLIEHFTNSSDIDAPISDDTVTNLIGRHSNDVFGIYYHTNIPGFDPMNNDNPADPSARLFYNNISKIPRTVLDGIVFNGQSTALTDNIITLRTLQDPLLNLELNYDRQVAFVDATAKITARVDFSANVSLHIVVIESIINTLTGSNGQTQFVNVVKKMLPDAAGTSLNLNLLQGDSIKVSQSWTYDNVYNAGNIEVIAFIQDDSTKEILQAIRGIAGPTSVGIAPLLVDKHDELDINIYPNPASDYANIVFNQISKEDIYLNVYNNIGQKVYTSKLQKGIWGYQLDLKGKITSGIYFIETVTLTNKITKKLIVVRD